MSTKSLPRIAVVGASSLIGAAVIDELRARKIHYAELHALDDQRSIGAPVSDEEAKLTVGDVAAFDFSRVELVFFCGRTALSERYAQSAAAHAWVIDGSAAFRMNPEVPLVVADVNPQALERVGSSGLIALPGSASAALATVLAPLHSLAGLVRAEVATYHAVSGSGRGAMDELAGETVAMLSGKKARGAAFGRQIAFNVIPLVDSLEAGGASREERRLWEETRRVLDLPALTINATAVRVPVFFGHSLAVHASFERAVDLADAIHVLQRGNGLRVIDPESIAEFPTPATLAVDPDQVYVGRIRADMTRDRGLNFWVVADNVRKCAAHNAVSVSQILVNRCQ
ncbi:MAG: aspartate-semialdehyde dehydrogenase [Gammaproteobacteria bacterium]|jgi:aspartate-semialdehyde dehydrogenase|nr:aspartate-semialdehyde dehydrogenase [Gammaproteobacteria bacterium]MEA3139715.1 aspartate-semialdehyde dehydrogenase [Gammaproteobacteria bacterium]